MVAQHMIMRTGKRSEAGFNLGKVLQRLRFHGECIHKVAQLHDKRRLHGAHALREYLHFLHGGGIFAGFTICPGGMVHVGDYPCLEQGIGILPGLRHGSHTQYAEAGCGCPQFESVAPGNALSHDDSPCMKFAAQTRGMAKRYPLLVSGKRQKLLILCKIRVRAFPV